MLSTSSLGLQGCAAVMLTFVTYRRDICRHYRTECQVLQQEWETIMQNCQYPQALPVAVANEHRAATERLSAIADSLGAMEQSTPNINESQVAL